MKEYLKALNDRNDPRHGVAVLGFIYIVGGATLALLSLAVIVASRL